MRPSCCLVEKIYLCQVKRCSTAAAVAYRRSRFVAHFRILLVFSASAFLTHSHRNEIWRLRSFRPARNSHLIFIGFPFFGKQFHMLNSPIPLIFARTHIYTVSRAHAYAYAHMHTSIRGNNFRRGRFSSHLLLKICVFSHLCRHNCYKCSRPQCLTCIVSRQFSLFTAHSICMYVCI